METFYNYVDYFNYLHPAFSITCKSWQLIFRYQDSLHTISFLSWGCVNWIQLNHYIDSLFLTSLSFICIQFYWVKTHYYWNKYYYNIINCVISKYYFLSIILIFPPDIIDLNNTLMGTLTLKHLRVFAGGFSIH